MSCCREYVLFLVIHNGHGAFYNDAICLYSLSVRLSPSSMITFHSSEGRCAAETTCC